MIAKIQQVSRHNRTGMPVGRYYFELSRDGRLLARGTTAHETREAAEEEALSLPGVHVVLTRNEEEAG